jgi:ankyrin repeat protein
MENNEKKIFAKAAETNDIESIKQIVTANPEFIRTAYTTTKGIRNFTPLHYASQMSNYDVINYLLTQGADPTVKTSAGNNPFQYAMSTENMDAIRALLEYDNSYVNILDNQGITALHYACLTNNYDMAVELLKHGADPTLTALSPEHHVYLKPIDFTTDPRIKNLLQNNIVLSNPLAGISSTNPNNKRNPLAKALNQVVKPNKASIPTNANTVVTRNPLSYLSAPAPAPAPAPASGGKRKSRGNRRNIRKSRKTKAKSRKAREKR